MTELDHLVVVAHTLDSGLAHVRATLGIEMPYGGAHARMGTHNHLLRLGPGLFLEVIAVDPSAPPPARKRWFQLDDPALQAELRIAPRLLTWVVRAPQIAERFLASRRPLGAIEPMERDGMRWLITFTNDGTLVDGGKMMPALIPVARRRAPGARHARSRRLARAVRGCTSGPRIVSPRPRVDRRTATSRSARARRASART